MNHQEWIKLTPEERRIKVAKLCGWRYYSSGEYWMPPDKSFNWVATSGLPDYLNDLNSMHEAEEYAHYRDVLWSRRYAREIQGIVVRDFNTENGKDSLPTEPSEAGWFCWYLGANATAAQRAEAFCITMEPS
jgi:hypothetical protein